VWLLGLSQVMPYRFGPVVLIVFGGVVMFLAVRRGPETNPPEAVRATSADEARVAAA
jgi:cytochrome c-type biogenesis protein CcmH/NrfF